MKTEIYTGCVGNAPEIIKNGGVVGIPTETVYGLAANGLDEEAVAKIYEVKGRPEVKPLALMVPDETYIDRYCRDVPEAARLLAKKFWPGPLSIVLKARTDVVPSIVRAGGETVSLRCPASPLTLEALKESGVPFAAPSANPSGSPSPKTAADVLGYFSGKIDAVIDGGECSLGIESTIISMSSTPYRILRQGALSADEIRQTLADGLKIIGITGGSGTGKTTVLESLRSRGALILDCDEIYHELLSGCRPMLDELKARFPAAFEEDSFNRKKLGSIVFSDEAALKDLNAITHKYVLEETFRRLGDFAMNGGAIAGIDAVELISSGIAEKCTAVFGVTASRENRIRRIMARDGISREYAEKRIDAQRSDEYYARNCTYILENNSGKEELIADFNDKLKGVL